jgi:two-component sensor histidine kinase
VGMPPGFDFRRDGKLGLQNILSLGETQLSGQVTFETSQGVACQIRFMDEYYTSRV